MTYQGKRTAAKKKGLPILLKVIIGLVVVLAIGFGIVYGVIAHYTNMMDKTVEDQQGLTMEEVWQQEAETTTVVDEAGVETEVGITDEGAEEAFAAADAALESETLRDVLATAPGTPGNKNNADIVNYLIIGSDRRQRGYYGNSDVMLLASINRTTHKIHLISFMRAMYVRIEGTKSTFNGMLNWAYSMEGPKLCVETIEKNFGITIDHYVTVDFTSFIKIIDALGGIEVDLTDKEAWYINLGTDMMIPYGENIHLDGRAALGLARIRGLDNDFVRTSRQRRVLTAIITKLRGSSVSDLNTLAETILPYVGTDMTNMEILTEIVNAVSYLDYEIDQLMLPIENMDGKHYIGNTHINGHEMYIVDWETNLPALYELMES